MSKANRKSAIPAGTSANAAGKSKAASPVTVAKPAAKKASPVPAKAKSARKPAAKSAVKAPMAMKSKIAKVAAVAAPKAKKTKTVRDSFNMPDFDYALIGVLKKRALGAATEVKKSELLRAGLKSLAAMNEKEFSAALKAVHIVKTGRPGKKK